MIKTIFKRETVKRIVILIMVCVISAANLNVLGQYKSTDNRRSENIKGDNLEFMLDSLISKHRLCSSILESGKYEKDSTNSSLFSDSYESWLKERYHLSKLKLSSEEVSKTLNYLNSGLHIEQIPDKKLVQKLGNIDVQNGNLTSETINFLVYYQRKLCIDISELKVTIRQQSSINNQNQSRNSSSRKETSRQSENNLLSPSDRGKIYSDAKKLNELEFSQNLKGWEFLISGERKKEKRYYPIEVEYYIYSQYPEYRLVSDYKNDHVNDDKDYVNKNILDYKVYDKNGKLIYVPGLKRKEYGVMASMECAIIERLVYRRDFDANKYNIMSEPIDVQRYVAHKLGKIKRNRFVPWNSQEGELYLAQLKSDHESEFGYLYIIERINKTRFRLVFLDKNSLKPSICAIVTYTSGSTPFTSAISIELTGVPDNIPPAIKN